MSGKTKKMEGNPDAALTSIGNYVFSKTLGEGNFAKVKLAKHKLTGQEVAVKIIDKMQMDEKKLSKLYREVRIMKILHNPNVVKLYEVVETKNTIFLVMEYVSGGELYDYLVVHGRMKEKEARAKFRQILNGVSYCHRKHVIHRDLKAENLLLDADLNVKIADFGFSNQYDPDGKLDTFCGSPPYAAPELFQGKKYTGPEVDVWSLGVILYVLTTGCLPFDGKNLQEMRESVCRGKYRIPFYLSEGCEKLLRKFLVRDPTKRPHLDILIDDPWLNEGYDDSPIVKTVTDTLVSEDKLVISLMESKFGVDRATLIANLKDQVYDDTMAIYFLLWNEKQKNGEASVIRIGEQMEIKKISSNAPVAAEASVPSGEPAHEPHAVTAIAEEDGSADLVAKQAEAAQAAPVVVPRVAGPQAGARRTRRATVSGEAEMKKIAIQDAEDPNLLNKLKQMNVGQADESIAKTAAVPAEAATDDAARFARKRPDAPKAARPVSMAETPKQIMSLPRPSSNAEEKKAAEAPAPVVRAVPGQGRKRTNTITGFLKGRKESETEASPVPAAVESKKSDDDFEVQTDDSKPRSLRFTFNSNTTSSKSPEDIVLEVTAACQANNYSNRLVSRFVVEMSCPSPTDFGGENTVIEVEVCKLPRLKNLHGLRFKRISGASADYKTACDAIMASIKL
eukprot:Partr_v1_DN27202_c0_g2_i1_m38488 putative Map microtubule affinity-regulating kinase